MKTYTLKVTEDEFRNQKIKKLLSQIMEIRIKMHRTDKVLTVSSMEYEFMRYHHSWASVEKYLPNKKDRMPGEVGKYMAKRVKVRGFK